MHTNKLLQKQPTSSLSFEHIDINVYEDIRNA